MEPWMLLGLGCVVYTTAELAMALSRGRRSLEFGAVDAETGRPLDVTCDRRTRAEDRRRRRRVRV